MSNTLPISVIMSVYNEPEEWVRQSVDSILSQTFKDFEFIIINDNPTNTKLKRVLREYAQKDNRIKIHENKKNQGLTKSLNIALGHAVGEYIARMDADDISMPNRFGRQFEFMEKHNNVVVVGSKIKPFGNNSIWLFQTFFPNDIDIRGQMFLNSGFAHPSVMIRKSVLDQNGIRYDETFRTAQDYKLWYDLRNLGEFANIPEALLMYRLSSDQITLKHSGDQQANRNTVKHLFREEFLKRIEINTKSNISMLKSTANRLDNETLTLISYYNRAITYETNSFEAFLRFCLNNRTKASNKELMVEFLLRLIKGRF